MNITTRTVAHAYLATSDGNQISLKSRVRIALAAFLAILRRDLLVTWRGLKEFLGQALVQPLFFLFIFGKVLPGVGVAQRDFGVLLLPGIVALTVFISAIQSVTLPLVLDLGFAREIDDRLLAPLPVNLVAVEKVIFAAIRGLVAGAVIFPLSYLILGNTDQVSLNSVGAITGIMTLTALAGASLGLFIGTVVKPEKTGVMFSLIFTPLIFTGCTYYPWGNLSSIGWFQIITLFNPLTYASEGLRFAMISSDPRHAFATLGIGWAILGLSVAIAVSLLLGTNRFRKRVVM